MLEPLVMIVAFAGCCLLRIRPFAQQAVTDGEDLAATAAARRRSSRSWAATSTA